MSARPVAGPSTARASASPPAPAEGQPTRHPRSRAVPCRIAYTGRARRGWKTIETTSPSLRASSCGRRRKLDRAERALLVGEHRLVAQPQPPLLEAGPADAAGADHRGERRPRTRGTPRRTTRPPASGTRLRVAQTGQGSSRIRDAAARAGGAVAGGAGRSAAAAPASPSVCQAALARLGDLLGPRRAAPASRKRSGWNAIEQEPPGGADLVGVGAGSTSSAA